MKILNALPSMGKPLSEEAMTKFLESKLNVQIATIDEGGEPVIQPTWFYYDRQGNKIYVETSKESKKVHNIRKKPSVYFSVDDETLPYKGAKGKGTARILEDASSNLPLAEKIMIKYLGTLDHPLAKMLTDNIRNGTSVILEIAPKFFSTWDMSRP